MMKCIMRVISTTAPASVPAITPACLQHLVDCLASVIRNPTNPTFNHYLFEALAVLLRRATSADPGQVAACEGALFPLMQAVLEQDVQEFAPYVFQLLALLLETRPLPLPPVYMAVFPALIAPALWERPANVPALVRLLQVQQGYTRGGVQGGDRGMTGWWREAGEGLGLGTGINEPLHVC